MSMENERRRFHRYPLQLPITLEREGARLDAQVVNASEGGCLLLVRVPLAPGEVLEVSIPLLGVSRSKLHVLRCQAVAPDEYSVATRFDAPAVDDATLARFSRQ